MVAVQKYGFFALAALCGLAAAGLAVAGPPGYAVIAAAFGMAFLGAGTTLWSNRYGMLVISLGAMAANGYLFSRKWASAVATDAICNINAVLNCDVVNSSAWSEAFGVPITLFGLAFYAGLAVASLAPEAQAKRFYQIAALFSVFNVLYSLFLAFHSYLLGAICVLCISIYVANAMLLWASLRGLWAAGGSLGDDLGGIPTSRDFLTLAAVFVVVGGLGGVSWKSQVVGTSIAEQAKDGPLPLEVLRTLYEQPRGPVRLDGTEPIIGSPTAPYQVVEWADFGCPHCAEAWREFEELTKEHKDLQVRFRVFPLTGDCNPLLDPHGPERCHAAYAAECARQQGRFVEMGTLLFQNQGYYSPEELEFMAQQVGLDVPKWQACLADPATAAGVLNDAKQGGEAGVMGTPALFLKGTHGDEFISIRQGPPAVIALIEAHKAGVELPPPTPPAPLPTH